MENRTPSNITAFRPLDQIMNDLANAKREQEAIGAKIDRLNAELKNLADAANAAVQSR